MAAILKPAIIPSHQLWISKAAAGVAASRMIMNSRKRAGAILLPMVSGFFMRRKRNETGSAVQ